jgi:serpin B
MTIMIILLGLTGCSVIPMAVAGPGLVQSKTARITQGSVPAADTTALVAGNSQFAFNLYQALKDNPGNLFYSPYSITQALAMTYAGANGKTQQQMAAALQFTLPQGDRLNAALNALDLGLTATGKSQDAHTAFTLAMANALWGQSGYAFQPDFLDVLSQYYGAGMHTLDFAKDQEAARQAINQWVSQQTNQRIQDLIARGVITPDTRMVLTNAIYFKASWQNEFNKSQTADGPFILGRDATVQVPMMHEMAFYGYVKENGVTVVELPYSNADFSMVIVMPDPDTLQSFEQSLDANKMAALINDLKQEEVDLTMPKFTFDDSFGLAKTLQGLGMTDAFTPGVADFSKIDGGKGKLFIQDVVHKAFIAVDEQGTEAAAATGVVVGTSAMPVETAKVVIDHPFLFLIRDQQSGTILFVGRVVNPK